MSDGGRGGPGQGRSAAAQEECVVWDYNGTLLYGRIIQAVLKSMIWEGEGVIGLGDTCAKWLAQSRKDFRKINPSFRKYRPRTP